MGIEFKTLEQFMPFWAQKILPAVYDDSLSYYQLLARILQKYNEIIEVVNKHSQTLVDHENRITENTKNIELNRQQIEALKVKLAELEEQVSTNTTNIEALTARVNNHDEAIAALNNAISNITKYNRNNYATFDKNTHEIVLYREATDSAGTKDFEPIPYEEWQSAFLAGSRAFQLDVLIDETYATSPGGFVIFSTRSPNPPIINAFGYVVENGYLHYFSANYSRVGSDANHGGTDNYRETELLDITNVKQSLGDGVYDTISQKILTEQLNAKLGTTMGITGASAGDFIKINEIDSDGKPVSYGAGTPAGGSVNVVQTAGQSTTDVMSQKAVTDSLLPLTNLPDLTNVVCWYPTTDSGTDGYFSASGPANKINLQTLSQNCFGALKNQVFLVRKPGSSPDFQRITWFKKSLGSNNLEFAWLETDGTTARAGINGMTINTAGAFSTTEKTSIELGGGSESIGDFTVISRDTINVTRAVCTNGGSSGGNAALSLGSTGTEILTNLHKLARPALTIKLDSLVAQNVTLTPTIQEIPVLSAGATIVDAYTGVFRGMNSAGETVFNTIYVAASATTSNVYFKVTIAPGVKME